MRKGIRKIVAAFIIAAGLSVGLFAVVTPSASAAATPCPTQTSGTTTSPSQDVPVTASSQAKVTNVVVSATGNSIRVQFDYALVNGATDATVDASLQTQLSFGVTDVTGSGHFDQTVSGLDNGSYTIFIISSGNPDYQVVGTNGQPFTVTLPVATTTQPSSGGFFARLIAALLQFYHRYF